MSDLERLAASVICAGFEGDAPDDRVLAELEAFGCAGAVLFARNVRDVESTARLSKAIQGVLADDAPAIVAIDQEGGRVARLRSGAAEIPSMMALGATGDLGLAERVGESIGYDLRRAGVNVDFAPVVDLALERANTVIGARAFGDLPERVAQFGAAVARGLERAGVVATAKHFPGHGSTAVDSHLDLPVVELGAADLRARDLVPFAGAIRAGVAAVMTAHVVLRAFDADNPATLSPAILTGLLRTELGFDGVCFTDCMEMNAIADRVGTARGAALAIGAGADCVLVSHRLELARQGAAAIAEAVRSGAMPRERLEEASRRVRVLRKRLLPALDAAPVTHAHSAAGREAARRAVTVLRGNPKVERGAPVSIVSFESETTEGAQGTHAQHASLNAALRRRSVKSESMRVPLDPSPQDGEMLANLIAGYGDRALIVLCRRAHVYRSQRAAAQRLLRQHPAPIFVSLREPYDVDEFTGNHSIVCTYGDEEVSIEALAGLLCGEFDPVGRLPIQLKTFGRDAGLCAAPISS